MFDPDTSYGLPPQPDGLINDETDRPDTWDTLTRFAAWFTTGIALTLMIRLWSALQPVYWILVIIAISGLAIALYVSRNVRLWAIAALLIAITLAGYWDGLSHPVQQPPRQIQEVPK